MNDHQLSSMRHTMAHILAAAIQGIHPAAQFGVGPVIDNGFYYDIKLPQPLQEKDLEVVTAAMRRIIAADLKIEQEDWSIEAAIKYFQDHNQPYKVELLENLQQYGTTSLKDIDQTDLGIDKSVERVTSVSIYKIGDFVDLCRGPHLDSTAQVGAFNLNKLAGAYWRGDENRDQLQRVYGLAFATEAELQACQAQLQLAADRDHRKLGSELDLYTISHLIGAGLPMFTPRGTVLREELGNFSLELQAAAGFEKVWTPHMAREEVYKVSGHFDKYPERFSVTSEESDDRFMLKPMNCPHHIQLFDRKPWSYRDLPVRYMENTTNYRDEKSGELHGLSRVRSLSQDDGHVFCSEDQIEAELSSLVAIVKRLYQALGMTFSAMLSFRDESDNYLGEIELWQQAEAAIARVAQTEGLDSEVGVGEAAFYGPKIDFMVKDSLGRQWQCATVQLDFVQPDRFDLNYIDSDGTKKRPVMIHKALLGSIERFLSVYIEHTGGNFPVWIAPEQVRILPLSEKFSEYAHAVEVSLRQANIRTTVDSSDESLGKRIRAAELYKVPYSLIVGEREAADDLVAVRRFKVGDQGAMKVEQFVEKITTEIKSRTV